MTVGFASVIVGFASETVGFANESVDFVLKCKANTIPILMHQMRISTKGGLFCISVCL
jgi:hypothetical protein